MTTPQSGREVIWRREPEPDGDGVASAPERIASPNDPDARRAAKGEELFRCRYKSHICESCDDLADPKTLERPRLITNVATTDATVPHVSMTAPIHHAPAARSLAPGRQYPDADHPSAQPEGAGNVVRAGRGQVLFAVC